MLKKIHKLTQKNYIFGNYVHVEIRVLGGTIGNELYKRGIIFSRGNDAFVAEKVNYKLGNLYEIKKYQGKDILMIMTYKFYVIPLEKKIEFINKITKDKTLSKDSLINVLVIDILNALGENINDYFVTHEKNGSDEIQKVFSNKKITIFINLPEQKTGEYEFQVSVSYKKEIKSYL